MGKKKRTGEQTDERKKGPETADVTEEPTNQQPDTENNDMGQKKELSVPADDSAGEKKKQGNVMKWLFGRLRKNRPRSRDSRDAHVDHDGPVPLTQRMSHQPPKHDVTTHDACAIRRQEERQDAPRTSYSPRLSSSSFREDLDSTTTTTMTTTHRLPFRRHASLPRTFRSRFNRREDKLQNVNPLRDGKTSENTAPVSSFQRDFAGKESVDLEHYQHSPSTSHAIPLRRRSGNELERACATSCTRSSSFNRPIRTGQQQKSVNLTYSAKDKKPFHSNEATKARDNSSYNLLLSNCHDVTVNICADDISHSDHSHSTPTDTSGLPTNDGNFKYRQDVRERSRTPSVEPVYLSEEAERFFNAHQVELLTQESLRLIDGINVNNTNSPKREGNDVSKSSTNSKHDLSIQEVDQVTHYDVHDDCLDTFSNVSSMSSCETLVLENERNLSICHQNRECQTSLLDLSTASQAGEAHQTEPPTPVEIIQRVMCPNCQQDSSVNAVQERPVGRVRPVARTAPVNVPANLSDSESDFGSIFGASSISTVPSEFFLSDSAEENIQRPVQRRRSQRSRDRSRISRIPPSVSSRNSTQQSQEETRVSESAFRHNNNHIGYRITHNNNQFNDHTHSVDSDIPSIRHAFDENNRVLNHRTNSQLLLDDTPLPVMPTVRRGINSDISGSIYEKLELIRTAILGMSGVLIVSVQNNRIIVTLSPLRQNIDDIIRVMNNHNVNTMDYECVILSTSYHLQRTFGHTAEGNNNIDNMRRTASIPRAV